ncbi:hypothetical protein LMG1866_01961 [Achromobacter ruhlandii]|uniref:carboxymuconolactone decarboxylase family protein n=1 Tax=Achromobacter ruhlandii TaxID=72557 RepID=UPI001467D267|nr:carboxymuconolactone decarboxylase family protein [Achromobacter ruhlandii]CAB3689003.1 hypothetical protein LMG1866_01961 [Achromobacter ruhlandii]
MLQNWTDTLANNRKAGETLGKHNPQLLSAFRALNQAQGATGTLDARTRELIALAVAVTTRCDGCIAAHADAARKAGVTELELSEALSTAIALNAGAAYVYSLRAMDALTAGQA